MCDTVVVLFLIQFFFSNISYLVLYVVLHNFSLYSNKKFSRTTFFEDLARAILQEVACVVLVRNLYDLIFNIGNTGETFKERLF